MKTKCLPLLVVCLLPASAFSQGSLTPPGAPAPTMKTLDQVEPRKEVNATNTPGDFSSVFKITTSGSYYLSGNITGASGKSGIAITASDVTLDLNGFALIGVPGSAPGISISSGSLRNIAIRNGVIRDWGSRGIQGISALNVLLQDLRLSNNGDDGLTVNAGSIVKGCSSSGNAGDGFAIFSTGSTATVDGGVVENCSATNNGGHGFNLQAAAISNCEAYGNGGHGIEASFGSTITDCLAVANVGDGINAGDGSTLTNCTARDNEGINGISAGVGSTLTNCTSHSNSVEFGIQAGDRSTLTNCTAALNTSAAADSWGISGGAQCTVSQCSASGNLNTNGTPTGSTGGGIMVANGSTVQNCTVAGNKGDGVRIFNDSLVIGNTCDSNGFPVGTGDGAGIHASSGDNRIEGNNVTDNTRGIDVDSSGNLIIKNSASGNATNYEIADNNKVGVIVAAPDSVAISGDTGGAGVGTTNPWANISF